MAGGMSPAPRDDPAAAHKWVLLIASAVSIVFLAFAALRETVWASWRQHQTRYAAILREKATDDLTRRSAASFKIQLRQVAIPPLNAVDRCVTCHTGIDDPRMTDVSQPYRVHPGDYLKIHPVNRFGCTSCHRGQGAAITFEGAKGDTVAWHRPLLPLKFVQASCGNCHDPQALKDKGAPRLALGARLFRERGCRSCHHLHGRGGPLGPKLDREGSKTRHELPMARLLGKRTPWNWHAQHLHDPGAVVADSRMPIPQLTEREREAVVTYLLSLEQQNRPEEYSAPDRILGLARRLKPGPPDGKALYGQFCRSCHGDGTFTRWDKKARRFIPAIRGRSLQGLASREYLLETLSKGRADTEMPAWHEKAGGLSKVEQDALLKYLRDDLSPKPPPPAPARGSVSRGEALFRQECAGCHGAGGRGGIAPTLASASFQKGSDAFIAAVIRQGRNDTPMPAFQPKNAPGLQDGELSDLLAFIRSLASAKSAAGGASTGNTGP